MESWASREVARAVGQAFVDSIDAEGDRIRAMVVRVHAMTVDRQRTLLCILDGRLALLPPWAILERRRLRRHRAEVASWLETNT